MHQPHTEKTLEEILLSFIRILLSLTDDFVAGGLLAVEVAVELLHTNSIQSYYINNTT